MLSLELSRRKQVGPGENSGKDYAQHDGWLQVSEPVAWYWFNITSVDSEPQEPGQHPELSSHFPNEVLLDCDLAASFISETFTELDHSWHGCFCVPVLFSEQTLLF